MDGIDRVIGSETCVAVTRAFGDRGCPGVSDKPEMTVVDLKPWIEKGYQVYVAVESDGIANRDYAGGAEGQKAQVDNLNQLQKMVGLERRGENLAYALANFAVAEGSSDNCTSVVMRVPEKMKENIFLSVIDGHGGPQVAEAAVKSFAQSAKVGMSVQVSRIMSIGPAPEPLRDTLPPASEPQPSTKRFPAPVKAMHPLVTHMLGTVEDWKRRGDVVMRYGEAVHVVRSRQQDGSLIEMSLPNPAFGQPPVTFERREKVTGISETYDLPDGLSPQKLDSYVMTVMHARLSCMLDPDEAAERLTGVFDLLAESNPQLKKLAFDRQDWHKGYHALMGVASAFNVQDIQYWLDNTTGMTIRKDEAYDALRSETAEIAGNIGWRPAPDTLRDIRRRIEEKKDAAPQSPRARRPPQP